MDETTGKPVPPASSQSKTKIWLIVIVSCVILCCFCVGAFGLLVAFGKPILNELGIIQAL